MLRGSLYGRGVWGRMDTCIYMAESLCCLPETITTLLTGYTPIFFFKKKVKNKNKMVMIPNVWMRGGKPIQLPTFLRPQMFGNTLENFPM